MTTTRSEYVFRGGVVARVTNATPAERAWWAERQRLDSLSDAVWTAVTECVAKAGLRVDCRRRMFRDGLMAIEFSESAPKTKKRRKVSDG